MKQFVMHFNTKCTESVLYTYTTAYGTERDAVLSSSVYVSNLLFLFVNDIPVTGREGP
jgi:hypothetical protein